MVAILRWCRFDSVVVVHHRHQLLLSLSVVADVAVDRCVVTLTM
jgi:hypothetical protein